MPRMCARTPLRQRARTRLWPAAGATVLIPSAAASPAVAATATAVEFYNTGLKHYFLTAYPEEVAGVDSGTAGPGWTRTGGQFTVYTDAAPGRVPVCRFYGTPGKGPNSHFYTADAAECEIVKNDAGWTFEGIAYYVELPANGTCADGTYTVYRAQRPRRLRRRRSLGSIDLARPVCGASGALVRDFRFGHALCAAEPREVSRPAARIHLSGPVADRAYVATFARRAGAWASGMLAAVDT